MSARNVNVTAVPSWVRSVWVVVREAAAVVWGFATWTWRHAAWAASVSCVAFGLSLLGVNHKAPWVGRPAATVLLVVAWVVPALLSVIWARRFPVSFERRVRGPLLRHRWVRDMKHRWPRLAVACGVGRVDTVEVRSSWSGKTKQVHEYSGARLVAAIAEGSMLRLDVKAGLGSSVDDVEKIAGAIRDACSAHSVRSVVLGQGLVRFELVMREHLAVPTLASLPEQSATGYPELEQVTLGAREDGRPWTLAVAGQHTLIAGATGAGKGSVFWGIVGGLAPAVNAGVVRVFAVDLKFGLEVKVGAALFSACATTVPDAIALLERVDRELAERGARMAGHARRHTATVTEPLIVVAIDELAVLTAYVSDAPTRKRIAELLGGILTRGRALGVVVVGALQDPRKETNPLRDLFSQTVALRMRTRDEVVMALGEGRAATAAAHRIPHGQQGVGYVVAEDGATVKVRATYWPDDLIRATAARYRTPVSVVITPTTTAADDSTHDSTHDGTGRGASGGDGVMSRGPIRDAGTGRARSPRKPRAPRTARHAPSGGAARNAGVADSSGAHAGFDVEGEAS